MNRISVVVLAMLAVAPVASSAAPITAPTDLNPGDNYRLTFVTSTTRDPYSTDIAVEKCATARP